MLMHLSLTIILYNNIITIAISYFRYTLYSISHYKVLLPILIAKVKKAVKVWQ